MEWVDYNKTKNERASEESIYNIRRRKGKDVVTMSECVCVCVMDFHIKQN
jgi:hypothetical protein